MLHLRKLVLFTILMLFSVGIACAAEFTSNDDGINSVNTVVEDHRQYHIQIVQMN